MTKYEAIMAAADFIEKNPRKYQFFDRYVPDDGGCTACMWGWIGHFMGYAAGAHINLVVKGVTGGGNPNDLYYFLPDLANNKSDHVLVERLDIVVQIMRAFAQQFKDTPDVLDPAYLSFRESLSRAREAA